MSAEYQCNLIQLRKFLTVSDGNIIYSGPSLAIVLCVAQKRKKY